MGDCLGKDQAGLIEEELLMRYGYRGLRVERAPASHRSEVVAVEKGLHLLDRHHAMVLAVPPAAGRELRLRVAAERKQRRGHRKAEQQ